MAARRTRLGVVAPLWQTGRELLFVNHELPDVLTRPE